MQRVLATVFVLSALVAGGLSSAAPAQEGEWLHASSLVDTPKYPKDFKHFDYVNPNAPKGGSVRLSGSGQTFDSLNLVLAKGLEADGLVLVFETLTTGSLDELDTSAHYGLIAESWRYPDDYSSVTYRLNPKARWHDGKPITPEDVVWSFNKGIELDPTRAFYYQHVVKAEVTGDREVTFTFDQKGNRELPLIVGEMTVLPKHWWEGTGPDGKPRDIARGTLEPPLGSGPYRVAAVVPGRTITYERVPDYWGADLNVNVGQHNFDRVSFEYFRDLNVEFEAFKAGAFDYWPENEAKRWATGYDFPAMKQGKVKKELVKLGEVSGVMVGFVPNLRRDPFKDRRVRQALNYALDFEELNRALFFGQYERINSFFYGIPLSWKGLPQGKELEILETVRDKVPPEVFTTEYKNPVNGTPQSIRENLRKAVQLLQEAGYRLEGGQMIGPDGEPLSFELLLNGPTIERVALPFQQALRRIGVDMRIRPVDSSQFVNRVRSRDFDMVYTGWAQTNSPGNEQLNYWGSEAADRESSQNYGGIKDPAVDELIKRVIFAKDREELVAATKALDRVLMWNQYAIPSYTILPERIAYWNRFGHPDPYPRFSTGFPTVWWWDAEAAAKTGGTQ